MTDVFSALTGTGDLLLPAARFVPLVGVDVTTFPPGAAVMDTTTPRRVMKVGWIAPGRLGSDPSWPASLFFEDAKWIDFERELFTYPSPGIYCDRIRYHLEPGAVATLYVNDTGVPAVPNMFLNPWDRASAPIFFSASWQMTGGTGSTQWCAYTVPSGKKLWVTSARVGLQRYTVNTAQGSPTMQIALNGQALLVTLLINNIVGQSSEDSLQGGPLVLPAGSALVGTYSNNDTGGIVVYNGHLHGLLFDV